MCDLINSSELFIAKYHIEMSINNDKTNLDLLEEDDEFEEFPCDGNSIFLGYYLSFTSEAFSGPLYLL